MYSGANPMETNGKNPGQESFGERGLRVLCLSFYPADGPSVRHRICNYRESWRNAGVSLTLKSFLTNALYRRRRHFGLASTIFKAATFGFCTLRLIFRLTTLHRYDVVIIHREIFPLGSAFFERLAARLNPRIVFDLDDAIWLPTPLSVNQRKLFWDANRVSDTMSACQTVVSGNAYLSAYSKKFNANVQVIPTPYLDLGGTSKVADEGGAPPIIVWIGNVGNEEYLEILRKPLEQLATEFDFILRIIGSAEASRLKMSGVQTETLVWREENEQSWLLECAIGIMPLFDREYEKGKCAFKLVQYFSAGMPVVASPVGMNAEVVEHGRNGFLATSEEEWYNALKSLLSNPDQRCQMGANGYALYQQRFTPSKNAKLWLDIFHNLCP